MVYVKQAKADAVGAEEYSMSVKRVEDVAPYLADGWEVATRGEWEAVQSEEVKARIAAGDAEFVDEALVVEAVAEVAPEAAPVEEAVEEKPEHAPEA